MTDSAVAIPEYTYNRRSPDQGVLYNAIRENVNTVFARLSEAGKRYPAYIRDEFDRYLDCGILSKGFLRVRCQDCKREHLVAFSCKCRGFCPSCCGRRMSEGTINLVDEILPDVPIRQWVLSFPYNLRYIFAYNHRALQKALKVMLRIIDRYYIKKAKQFRMEHPDHPVADIIGAGKLSCGSVTLIQRFGGHLNLNPHFHVLYLDGVYNKDGKFYKTLSPSDEEVGGIILKIRQMVFKTLERSGYISGYDINFDRDDLFQNHGGLSEILLASVQDKSYLGINHGQKIKKKGQIHMLSGFVERKGTRCIYKDGFSLHANTLIPANDRVGRERLVGYVLRPPLGQDRLRKCDDGKYEYKLKRRWDDGTEAIILDGEELVTKLIALIPPLRLNVIRYHGVLGPNSSLRRHVVRMPKAKARGVAKGEETTTKIKRYISWSKLLARVFKIDITTCHCGGTLKIVSAILEVKAIRAILEHLDLPTTQPVPAVARAPPAGQYEFCFS